MADDDRRCPDDGTCHHRCVKGCFRVSYCVPLTGAYESGRWPESVAPLSDYTTEPVPAADDD